MTAPNPPDNSGAFVSSLDSPSAKETNAGRWTFTELGPDDDPGPVDWIDPDLPVLARGMVSLLAGAPKAGKTTLVRSIIRRVVGERGAVLAISEEPRAFWRRAFGDSSPGLLLPTVSGSCATEQAWALLTQAISEEVIRRADSDRPIRLVVVDTIAGLGPIRDENSAPEVTRAMNLIRPIADAGCAVLCLHHTRKPGSGGETEAGLPGTAFRGSTAFQASVDILAALSAWNPANPTGDRRRRINAIGRLPECSGSWGVEVWPEKLRYTAFPADEVSQDAIGLQVLGMLRACHPTELTVNQIHAAVNDSTPTNVGAGKIRGVLTALERSGSIVQGEKSPAKGRPARYSFVLPPGGIEEKRSGSGTPGGEFHAHPKPGDQVSSTAMSLAAS